jgi:membrane-associated protein
MTPSAVTAALAAAPALGPDWLDPNTLLDRFGAWALWGAAAVIFAECGLLLGFFLPGDSLLFTVGLFIGSDLISQPLWLACLVLTVAAFAGNVVGYQIGRAGGPTVLSSGLGARLVKQKHVDRTVEFFENRGPTAIVLARFVPIVRTFITVIAGIGRMDRRRYLTYSAVGALLWATGVTVLGRLLGEVALVRDHIEVMLLAMVGVSVLPIAAEALRHRLLSRRGQPTPAAPTPLGQAEAPGPGAPYSGAP